MVFTILFLSVALATAILGTGLLIGIVKTADAPHRGIWDNRAVAQDSRTFAQEATIRAYHGGKIPEPHHGQSAVVAGTGLALVGYLLRSSRRVL